MAGECHINLQHNITLSLHDIHRGMNYGMRRMSDFVV